MSSTEYSLSPTERPAVISFIGVIMYVQAALAATAAVALLIWRNDVLDWLEQEGAPLTEGGLTGTIIAEFVVATVLALGAAGLMRGSGGWRMFVTLIQAFAMSVASYTLVAHHVGGLVYRAVFSLFVGVFVLWSLWGNEQSQRYFDENG